MASAYWVGHIFMRFAFRLQRYDFFCFPVPADPCPYRTRSDVVVFAQLFIACLFQTPRQLKQEKNTPLQYYIRGECLFSTCSTVAASREHIVSCTSGKALTKRPAMLYIQFTL